MTNLFVTSDLKKVTIIGEYWVKSLTDLSVEQIDKITLCFGKIEKGELSAIQATVKVILLLVKEWNFTKGDGQPIVEMNEENLNNLKYSLIDKIFSKVTENNHDLKELLDKGKEKLEKKKEDTQT